jgi:hypothetical protein
VIPSPFRLKGGGPLLGADVHGQPGPFGTYRDGEPEDDTAPGQVPVRPALARWLAGARPGHPVHALAQLPGAGPVMAPNALEELLASSTEPPRRSRSN